ncbi:MULTISPECIES: hypothetical protein [unclassified Streptomyces]|uniref:hypothetical protein n=1 Tax=unclassified Streptomyces TaxID=2593676 RepID=UPI00278C3896|nr:MULTISPECIES: hypothetical protein [unclassified Streptomyces]
MSSSADDLVSDGLAHVCGETDRLREDLGGAATLLDEVLGAARAGRDLREPLDALHRAIRATGDVLGVYGGSHPRRDPGAAVAGLSPVPTESAHVCPSGLCSRYVWADRVGEAPVCEVNGRPLLRQRLP